MKEGWKVLKFHETIIELQSKEPWKTDLNGNSDYNSMGGLVGLNASSGLWETRDVENKDVTEGMSLDSELPFLLHCAHMCMYVLMYTPGQAHVWVS